MTDINEVMLNPVRMRIIQELAAQPQMTTADLSEKINDVPRTTLYRHINVLLKHEILTVVSEKRIRGSVERTLALNVEEIKKHNRLENASQNAFAFLMNRYARFHNYFSDENAEPGKDRVFLNNTILMLDDNEFDQFLIELRDLLIKYSNKNANGRKARDISILSTPIERD
jgi:DNA-binding transcriptional ArsR family regulator